VSVAAAIAIVGALAVQPVTPARTNTPDALTVTAIAVTPEHLVDLALATMEWDDTVGILSLLQRDAPSTTFQRAYERQGALLSVDDGVGAAPTSSLVAVMPPTATLEGATALSAVREADRLAAQEAARLAKQEAARLAAREAEAEAARLAARTAARAERRAEAQAERRAEAQRQAEAERQARAEAERQAEAERRARAEAQRRADAAAEARRRAERRSEPAPAPSTSDWNNAPIVTWYGPGFYGNRTACGQRYTREIIGVAHRTLPCGTMVQFRWNGITATAPVIDRGPYATAAHVFDFSAALSCDVFRPRGVANGCFTRNDVAWRVVGRAN